MYSRVVRPLLLSLGRLTAFHLTPLTLSLERLRDFFFSNKVPREVHKQQGYSLFWKHRIKCPNNKSNFCCTEKQRVKCTLIFRKSSFLSWATSLHKKRIRVRYQCIVAMSKYCLMQIMMLHVWFSVSSSSIHKQYRLATLKKKKKNRSLDNTTSVKTLAIANTSNKFACLPQKLMMHLFSMVFCDEYSRIDDSYEWTPPPGVSSLKVVKTP